MWCWWRMEKISWTDHVRNEEVLLRVKEHSEEKEATWPQNMGHKMAHWKKKTPLYH
jgi:hypothetical protein